VALKACKDEEGALEFLGQAEKLAPADAAIQAELAAVKKAAAERKAKEKKAYSKAFA
jgi:peptidyl-prolyl isomerase D